MTSRVPLQDNLIVDKTFQLATQISRISQILQERKHFILSNQLQRAGTSIDANTREAPNAESKADFIHSSKLPLKKQMKRRTGRL